MQGYHFRNLQNLNKSWHVQICCCAEQLCVGLFSAPGPSIFLSSSLSPGNGQPPGLPFTFAVWCLPSSSFSSMFLNHGSQTLRDSVFISFHIYISKKTEKENFYLILPSNSQPQIFEQQDGLQPESSASNGQAKMGLVSPDQRTFTKEQYMGRLSAGGSQIHVGQGFRPLGPFVSKNIMGWVWRFCWENKRCVFRSY